LIRISVSIAQELGRKPEIDNGNIDAMDELVAEDYLDHSPPPIPGLKPGREGVKQAFRIFWEATPGRHHVEDRWHPKAILYEDDDIREQFYFENHPQTYATEAEANAVGWT
jgi:hypothetical protein